MAATKVLIVLAIASLLLVYQQEIISLQTSPDSWAGQANLKPGEVFRDRMKNGTDGPEMIVISAGKFRMGDIQGKYGKGEQPIHEVHIRKPLAVSRYEITFDQYDEFSKTTGRDLADDEGWGRGRRPVVRVSWNEAVAYAEWISEQTGKRYRLPSEAEWEYAARAGTETVYWWGNELTKGLANCIGCESQWDRQTAPVGSFKPNAFGLYDTSGNVMEWVQDCWHDSYRGAPSDGSAWAQKDGGNCGLRGIRGGHSRRAQDQMSSSFRRWNRPDARLRGAGIRLVREID
jgi:formylglycine-generating enzyme required for sulfatase activity